MLRFRQFAIVISFDFCKLTIKGDTYCLSVEYTDIDLLYVI